MSVYVRCHANVFRTHNANFLLGTKAKGWRVLNYLQGQAGIALLLLVWNRVRSDCRMMIFTAADIYWRVSVVYIGNFLMYVCANDFVGADCPKWLKKNVAK